MTIGIAGGFSEWPPDNAQNPPDINILPSVYGTLVRISDNGEGVEPMIAKSLDYDGTAKTLTVHLQPDAEFSNGTPVTSADIAFDVAQWQAGPNHGNLVSSIESVDTPDAQTAVFHLSIPDTFLATALALNNFAIMPKDFGGVTSKQYFAKPIGAGPYMIESETPGEDLVLTRNPHYYDKSVPYLDKLTLKFISDPNQRAIQFKAGQLDFLEPPAPFDEAAQFNPADVTYVKNSNISQDLILNWGRKPGNDINFRKAVSLALDRKKLAQGVFNGQATPSRTALPPNVPNQVQPSGDWTIYDKAEAQQLLAKSSYKGQKLQFIISSSQANSTVLAQAIQSQLADIGIKVDVVMLDFQTWIGRWSTGDYDMSMTYNTGNFPSAGLYMSVLATDFGFLFSAAPNAVAKSAFIAFRTAPDDAARDAAVKTVEDYAFKNVAYVPVVDTDLPYVVKPGVHVPENGIAIYTLWDIWRDQ